jgi:hypothetical protein
LITLSTRSVLTGNVNPRAPPGTSIAKATPIGVPTSL